MFAPFPVFARWTWNSEFPFLILARVLAMLSVVRRVRPFHSVFVRAV